MDRSSLANLITVNDLLHGSQTIHDIAIPPEILYPETDHEEVEAGVVRLRPMSIAVMNLIVKAAREDAALIPLLMVKESLVEPELTLKQVQQMHVGLVHFLISKINHISGLDADGETLASSVQSPLGRTHIMLAKHFGWTPEQVSQLTPGQVAVYLAGIERLNQLQQERDG